MYQARRLPRLRPSPWEIIDEVVGGDLKAAALAFAQKVIDEKRPIRKVSTLTVKVGDPAVFDEYAKSIARKQRGFLAPFQCIKAVEAATKLSFSEGMKRERELFLELKSSFAIQGSAACLFLRT